MPSSWFFQTSNQISTMELRKMLMPFEHLKILGSIVVQLMAGAGYVAAAALCKLSNKSEATGGSAADHSRCDQVIWCNLWNWTYELRIIFRNKLSAMASPKRNPQKHWAFPVFLTRTWRQVEALEHYLHWPQLSYPADGWIWGQGGHTACPLLGNVGDVFCAWSLHGLRVSSIQLPIFSSVQDSGR